MIAASWPALCGLAFTLGARHALDADHIAVIDGIARRNALARPIVAQASGLLFSLGHGLVVMLVALAALPLAARATPPVWLGPVGVATSAIVLVALGILNLRAALRSAAAGIVGWKAGLIAPRGDPLVIVAVGALFAISFDTVAIALALGLAGGALGGVAASLSAAACFGAGMLLLGGIDGIAIVRLARASRARSAGVARIVTGIVGALNLAIGLLAIAGFAFTTIATWREASGLLIGGVAIGGSGLAFVLAPWIMRDGARGRGGLSPR